jgi:soluble cytochrome b562
VGFFCSKFNESELKMKLTKSKKTPFEQQQLIIKKCKDKSQTDQFIKKYQKSTKSAIEQILYMGESVNAVNEKCKKGELNQYDLNYFCMSVGISQKGSTFRKYDAIGKNADKFRQHMDKLPSAFSVLYEIATLDADTFERIIINSTNINGLTLKQVRQLANKNPVPSKNSPFINLPNHVPRNQIAKVMKKINRFVIYISSTAKESELDSIVNTFDDLQKKGLLRFEMPEITQFEGNDDADQLRIAA